MKPNCAYNLTRRDIQYRHDAFSAGLRAAGYDVRPGPPAGRPGDIMLIWNRYGDFHAAAAKFEREGGSVIVVENGYLRGPKDSTIAGDYYAISLDVHNGGGRWPEGGPERFDALDIELQPLRSPTSGHVLVAPNRSFGTPGRIMPVDWSTETVRRLRAATRREVRWRAHPGEGKAQQRPLDTDLDDCHCVVIWYSSAGLHALIRGIPVISLAPSWIAMGAAGHKLDAIETPFFDADARRKAFERVAWAQWSLAEIESGEPFVRLREVNRASAGAAAVV